MISSSPPPPTIAGFHITSGVALRIPAGGLTLTLDDNGDAKMELKSLLLRLDTSVHWLEIALDGAKGAWFDLVAQANRCLQKFF